MRAELRSCVLLASVFFLLQAGFWWPAHRILPDMGVVPELATKRSLDILSFGDEEFTYRAVVFLLNNAGDTFGRSTALYKYDLKDVYNWFTLLDHYNPKANVLAYLASYYFSQTQRHSDVAYMVRYLEEHSARDLKSKWWWRTQAVFLAKQTLKDLDWALALAKPLQTVDGIPFWARQMAAFVYEQRGQFGDALAIIESIIKHSKEIPPEELRFMEYFVKERLNEMEAFDALQSQRVNQPASAK